MLKTQKTLENKAGFLQPCRILDIYKAMTHITAV